MCTWFLFIRVVVFVIVFWSVCVWISPIFAQIMVWCPCLCWFRWYSIRCCRGCQVEFPFFSLPNEIPRQHSIFTEVSNWQTISLLPPGKICSAALSSSPHIRTMTYHFRRIDLFGSNTREMLTLSSPTTASHQNKERKKKYPVNFSDYHFSHDNMPYFICTAPKYFPFLSISVYEP